MAVSTLSIGKEAGISFAINATLSLAFFLAVFGLAARPLAWDTLAPDFLPQSIAVALMSALVPALIVRHRLALALPIRAVVLRAIGFAVGGAMLGGLLAWFTQSVGLPPLSWSAALAVKLLYGGSLGALITSLVLRRMI